jgi:heat shock protein HslJ
VNLRALPVAIGLVLLLAACREAGGPPSQTLDGSWRLLSGTNAGQSIPLVAGRDITFTVDGEKVSGSACNIYGGTIAVSGSHVTLSAMSMTEMACEEPMMLAEAAYHAALAKVVSASRSGTLLTLSGPGVELRFSLVPPVADAPLLGTDWILTTLTSGATASSVVGERASLRFSADGVLRGETGCRGFAGRFELAGDEVTVRDLVSDKRLCTREVATQDAHVLSVVAGPFRIAIQGDNLTISTDGGLGLAYRADGVATGSPSPTIANPDPVEPTLPAGSLPPIR